MFKVDTFIVDSEFAKSGKIFLSTLIDLYKP